MCLVMAGIQLPMSSLYDPARGGGGGTVVLHVCFSIACLCWWSFMFVCILCFSLVCLPYPRASGIKETMATSD